MATLDDLLALVTSEYQNQPNYKAVLTTVLQPFVDGQNLMDMVNALYDIDVAVGQQLDVVGQWVGFSRQLDAPLVGVYFAFDTPGVGFDEGVWYAPPEPKNGVINLDDATYRLMLFAKIAANISDGTTVSLERVLNEIFVTSPGTLVFIQDLMDMTMNVLVAGVIPSALFLSLLANDYIPFRPGAVKLNDVIVVTAPGPLFGFDVENDYISGFDVGSWGTVYVPPT